MTPAEIERILSTDQTPEPSSGFVQTVMAAVRIEALEPLRFPWFRFAVGLGASVVMAASGTVLLERWAAAWTPVSRALAPMSAVAPELGYGLAAGLVGLGLASLPRLFRASEIP
jgi:hypothetical protein